MVPAGSVILVDHNCLVGCAPKTATDNRRFFVHVLAGFYFVVWCYIALTGHPITLFLL